MTRKIDKRACRKFAMPELEFNLNEGVLHVESYPYIIRTAVQNIAGQRILVLYIYQRESILAGSIKPRWVMFHSRDDFATLSFREDAKATWQCSTLGSLDRIGGFDSKCAFYRQQDESRVARFCKCERGAISMLGYLQRLISYRKELERKWKKQRAIIDRMKYVPVLPRDLKGFIHREVMPQYIFYDYQRKAPGHAYCTACRHEVRIAAAKHNTSGLCPRCKKKITFKCRGRRGRIFDRETVQVLQKAEGNGLVLRIIKVYRSFADSDIPNHFEIWENARQFITLSSSGQCSVDAYYYHYKAGYDLTPWCNGYRPVFDRWKYNFTADMSGVLYQRNLSDTLKDTPWAYSQLEAFSGIASFSGVATFLSAYIKRPKIEHLIKMKLYRLVSGIIYGGYSYSALQAINFNGENMRAILGIDRPYFPLLRELNPSIDQLHLIRQLLQADHKPSTEQIKWFIASKISNADAAKELLAHMSVHKLQRYVEQQFAPEDEAALKRVDYYKMNTLITDYHDYLCMCKELQYDVKNSFILFPRELKAAHDSVAKTLKDKRTAEHEKAIAGSFDEWQKRYQYQSKELMMIPPHSAKEIVDEGAALHHCVRLYVKNVAEKKSVILFVRSVDEPDKSLCTVEVKDGQVTQARGFDNKEPPAQITAFIEQWKQRVLYASDKAAA
ncbi:PcfJ domain-containing protein [Vescimonas sanitatis]|uniref:PcfJ domain-containing protein n=1 Tax=Vescimonas sanitatis TaxID=3376993 RepID=UPI003B81062C